jgi:nitrite reductase (NADH) large subunit
MKKYLIIGNGTAGTTAAENIRKRDASGQITIVTEEDFPYYYRIRLNDFICGEISENKLLAKSAEWYAEKKINLLTGVRITSGNPAKQEVVTARGEALPYDALLIATGSHSFVPPIPGAELPGVFTLRSISDAGKIIKHAQGSRNVVLIGGGLLGLEAGNALRKIGKKITVVEFFPRLLPRQLDQKGADKLTAIMEAMGFSFRIGASTQEIYGEASVEKVLLAGGESLAADMVLLSAGVRPNLELAKLFNLKTSKGIVVDSQMRTSQPGIFAAGDVAEFNGVLYGIWPAATQQGKIAGAVMAGGSESYAGTTMANKLKVAGIELASAGEVDSDNKYESHLEEAVDVYKKFVINNNRLIGVIMLGDTKDFAKMTKAIADQTPLEQLGMGR